MNAQTLIHPAVVRVIRKALVRHGFQPGEIEAAIADVTVRAIEDAGTLCRREMPRTLEDWQTFALGTAVDYAVDERGRLALDLPEPTPEEEDDDDAEDFFLIFFGADPTDQHQTEHQLAVLLDMLDNDEMPEMGWEILELLGERVDIEEAAAILDLDVGVVCERLREMRTRFFDRLGLVGRLTTSVCDEALDAATGEPELEPEPS